MTTEIRVVLTSSIFIHKESGMVFTDSEFGALVFPSTIQFDSVLHGGNEVESDINIAG